MNPGGDWETLGLVGSLLAVCRGVRLTKRIGLPPARPKRNSPCPC
jgi:hypothetical protein